MKNLSAYKQVLLLLVFFNIMYILLVSSSRQETLALFNKAGLTVLPIVNADNDKAMNHTINLRQAHHSQNTEDHKTRGSHNKDVNATAEIVTGIGQNIGAGIQPIPTAGDTNLTLLAKSDKTSTIDEIRHHNSKKYSKIDLLLFVVLFGCLIIILAVYQYGKPGEPEDTEKNNYALIV